MNDITPLKAGEIALYLDDRGQILPCDGESSERYLKLKRNVPYIFKMKMSRNYEFHKKYFAMINMAYHNQSEYQHKDWFRKSVLIGTGNCDIQQDPKTGMLVYIADSLSFEKCSESQFQKIYDDTLSYLIEKYGFTEEFVDELLSYGG